MIVPMEYTPINTWPDYYEMVDSAKYVYGLAAEAGNGRVIVDRCKVVGPVSRRCRVRVNGDAPLEVSMRVRRVPATGTLIISVTPYRQPTQKKKD